MNLGTYLPALLLAAAAGFVHWLSWQRIAKPRAKKPTQEVIRILVWLGSTFVIQIVFVITGLIFLREISSAYLSFWGIVFLGVTAREILRLHRGTNLS